MPQVNPQSASQKTATSISEGKPFRERLRDRYKATDYVRVINIDNEEFTWQYFPIDGELETFDDNGATRVIQGRQRFTSNFDGLLQEQMIDKLFLGIENPTFNEPQRSQTTAKK